MFRPSSRSSVPYTTVNNMKKSEPTFRTFSNEMRLGLREATNRTPHMKKLLEKCQYQSRKVVGAGHNPLDLLQIKNGCTESYQRCPRVRDWWFCYQRRVPHGNYQKLV